VNTKQGPYTNNQRMQSGFFAGWE